MGHATGSLGNKLTSSSSVFQNRSKEQGASRKQQEAAARSQDFDILPAHRAIIQKMVLNQETDV